MNTIQRSDHDVENPYAQVRRKTLQDVELSWAARGLLGYLLSKPDDWKVNPANLQQKCGRTKVYSILTELIKAGYIKRVAQRKDGKITHYDYFVSEEPRYLETSENDTKQPENGSKPSEKLYTGLLHTENSHITKEREVQNKETTITSEKSDDGKKSKSKKPPPRKRSAKQLENDAMVDAIVAAYPQWDAEAMTDSNWSKARGVAKELLTAGYNPEDVQHIHDFVAKKARAGWSGFTINTYKDYAAGWRAQQRRRDNATAAATLTTPQESKPKVMTNIFKHDGIERL